MEHYPSILDDFEHPLSNNEINREIRSHLEAFYKSPTGFRPNLTPEVNLQVFLIQLLVKLWVHSEDDAQLNRWLTMAKNIWMAKKPNENQD